MPLAADIPHFYCFVRAEFLYDMKSHHRELIPCCVFAVDSIEGHAIGFDIMTDFGGQFARLPISALVWKETSCMLQLQDLELWNNFSYDVEAHEYAYLRQMRCSNRDCGFGTYMFTLSWKGSRYAEDPGEGGFKRAHIIRLDNGCFAAQPNNRLRWYEPSFITAQFPEKPTFKTNSHIWNAENGGWKTEDSDAYFYKTDRPEEA